MDRRKARTSNGFLGGNGKLMDRIIGEELSPTMQTPRGVDVRVARPVDTGVGC